MQGNEGLTLDSSPLDMLEAEEAGAEPPEVAEAEAAEDPELAAAAPPPVMEAASAVAEASDWLSMVGSWVWTVERTPAMAVERALLAESVTVGLRPEAAIRDELRGAA